MATKKQTIKKKDMHGFDERIWTEENNTHETDTFLDKSDLDTQVDDFLGDDESRYIAVYKLERIFHYTKGTIVSTQVY